MGQPIDASGNLDGLPFIGAPELGALLTDDPRFRACFVESWRRWGFGDPDDEGDVSLMDPMRQMTQRRAFRTRTGDAAGGPSPAAGPA